jgi:hypothetical protein
MAIRRFITIRTNPQPGIASAPKTPLIGALLAGQESPKIAN